MFLYSVCSFVGLTAKMIEQLPYFNGFPGVTGEVDCICYWHRALKALLPPWIMLSLAIQAHLIAPQRLIQKVENKRFLVKMMDSNQEGIFRTKNHWRIAVFVEGPEIQLQLPTIQLVV